MRLLVIQAGRQVSTTDQDQSIQFSHHRPDHPKEQHKGPIITQDLQRIIALDQGQCRNEARQTSRFQHSVHGGRIPTVGRPPAISQRAPCSKDANVWSLAQAKTVALLLFCYPMRKQITDGCIDHRLHIHVRT